MKYLLMSFPMLLGMEVVTLICLLLMTVCFFADLKKADERRKYR